MTSLLFVGYVFVFSLSAVACFGSLPRVRNIRDTDVRHSLLAFFTTSGSWASAHVGYLVVPSETLKLACYLAGLVVGFSTIGAWLWFCSAYTNRSYHRQRPYQYLAVAVFGVVVALKLTNPVHSLYFTTEFLTSPFPHLAVSHGIVHWVVMAFAYALAFVGFFMLFERFVSIGFSTTPLAILVGLTALPVVFDIMGLVSPVLLDMTYEPLGVAVFAVGVSFVYFERFQAITLTGETDVPAIFLDEEYQVRDFNSRARELFPSLEGSLGKPLSTISPELVEGISTDEHVIERTRGPETRYYLASSAPFTAGNANIGYVLTISDVTEREQYRHELERKTQRLEEFASIVSHDLRNPLNVASIRLGLARDEHDSEHLEDVDDALQRMETLIDDLLTLAREGQAIEETEEINLSTVVESAWGGVEVTDAELTVVDDTTMVADVSRLQQLFENLFRNAVEHGSTSPPSQAQEDSIDHAGSDVTVTVGTLPDGFYIEDDGPGIPEDERDDIFAFGYTTTADGTGFGLSIVKEIVDAHGWEIAVTDGTDGGARFELTNIDRHS